MTRHFGIARLAWSIASALAVCTAMPTTAGIVIYEDGDKKVEVGAQIQLEYVRLDVDGDETIDELDFRRLRPHLAGTVSRNWWAKIQFDLGRTLDGDEIAIKDAYVEYRGWQEDKNLLLTIGNSKTPFSRDFLTSSARQQTVERGFVGDHNFGSPDRNLGIRLDGHNDSKKLTYRLAVGVGSHDPGIRRMDFDTPANHQSDWNDGLIFAGRIDFHPRGYLAFSQSDFHSEETKVSFSLAFFTWSNDGDVNTYTDPATGRGISTSKADLDRAQGYELSAGLRGKGISVDAEYQLIRADTVDPAFTGGIYRAGTVDLDKFQIEGGYMLPGNRFELVGKWEMQDADNYPEPWKAYELGITRFWNQHKTKALLNFRHGENTLGELGAETDTVLVQFQYLF